MMNLQNPVFIPGPTNIPEALRKACDMPTIDHRSAVFGEMLHPVRGKVREILKSESAEVFLFPSTGTGGWETALTNTLSRTYQHVPMQMDTLGREDTTSTFGILHLARNEPYFATARAMTGGKVYTLSSADFNDLIGAPCSSSRRSWVALTPRCWCRSQPDHRAGVAAQSEHGAAPTVPRCVSRRPPTG